MKNHLPNDTTERQSLPPSDKTKEKQQRSYGILKALFEGARDAIFVKDLDGRYLMVNSTLAGFLNLSVGEIVGKKDRDLYPPETASHFEEQDAKILSSGETQVFEGIASAGSENDEQFYLVTKSVYRDEKGKIAGLIGISHDITDRKKAEEQRIALFKEQEVRLIAEEANRLKDEFLAALSHELRTPMACILGWATLLQANEFNRETRDQALATIERNARAQMQLISDLLDVSRVIAGHKPLDLREIDLVSVARAAIESVKITANAKQIKLKTDFAEEPIIVLGDFNRLQQIVWNLLVNAIKFTPESGQITISLRRAATHVEIAVSDTGRGIEPDFLPFVFERFRQANQQITETYGGLGLGLAIVRHFAELHGGAVKAESAGKDAGAKFTITIPLVADALETQRGRNKPGGDGGKEIAHVTPPDLSGVTVLIADDDLDTVKMLEAAFNSRGAAVVSASSADQAVEIVRNQKPDLLIGDVEMKSENRYSLIKKVRALSQAEGGKTPAVAFTARAGETDRINAFLAGFQVHVSKPANPLEIIAIARSLTGKTAE